MVITLDFQSKDESSILSSRSKNAALVKRLTRITFYDEARVRIPYAVQ